MSEIHLMESLETYVAQALELAEFEEMEDDAGFCATIPGFNGLIAFAENRSALDRELKSVLEGWVDLALKRGIGLPSVESATLIPH